jgi:outer membrane protein assembly factor BamB
MSEQPKTETPTAPKVEAPKPAAEAPKPAAAPAAAPAAVPAKAEEKPKPAAPAPKVAAAPSPVMPPVAVPPGATPGLPKAARPESEPTSVVKLEISTKVLALIVSGLTVLICFFCGTTLYLLVRLADRHPVVMHQPPGMDKPGIGAPPKVAAGAPAAAPGDASAPQPAAKAGGEEPAPGDAPPAVDPNEVVKIGESFAKFDGKPSTALLGSWPTFRGPKFDNVMQGEIKLAEKWPAKGPPVLWSMELGEGHAGAAIHKGKVYVLDYDQDKKEDALRCFSFDDGKEIWRRSYKVKILRNHGISRTVPAVSDKYVVSIGPRCHTMCVDAETGDLKWGMDLVKDFGTKQPLWYTSQCPLIDGTTAVIAPGGTDILIMGVDCETGKILWKTPNPKKWAMSHASVIPMTVGGKKTYVYTSIGGTFAVSAEPADAGTMLWETDEWTASVVAPSAVPLENGYLFLTAGYSTGSMLAQVTEAGGKFSVKTVWKKGVKEGLACEQQTPILWKGHLFSIQPKDAGPTKQQFVCMNPLKDEGALVWESGKQKQFGLGPFILADEKFYILNDDGWLTMCRASLTAYEELARVQIIPGGKDAWAPIAVVNGRMLLRDEKKFMCIDVDKRIE